MGWLYQRRRRRAGGGDDIAALVAALGGDEVVLAIYDARHGVTASGGFVDAWDDARGAVGFGPQLAGLTTTRPAHNTDDLTIDFDGSDDVLATAEVAAFNMQTAKSLIIVGATTGANTTVAGLFSGGRRMGLVLSGSNIFGVFFDPGEHQIDSIVDGGAARRALFVSQNGTTTGKIEIPDEAAVTNSITDIGSNNNALTLGRSHGTGTVTPLIARAAIVLEGAYSDAQRDTIMTWAVAQHAAVPT